MIVHPDHPEDLFVQAIKTTPWYMKYYWRFRCFMIARGWWKLSHKQRAEYKLDGKVTSLWS